jgi:hypothetical protein
MTAATPIPSQSDGNSERPKLHAAAPPVAEHNEPAPSTGAVQPPAFLAERAKRALREEFLNSDPRLWIVLGLCRLLPPLGGNRLRTSLLRLGGLKIGAGTVFGGVLHVHGGAHAARRLQVGASCWINADCTFDSSADIVIEDDVAIGQQVLILTNTQRGVDRRSGDDSPRGHRRRRHDRRGRQRGHQVHARQRVGRRSAGANCQESSNLSR